MPRSIRLLIWVLCAAPLACAPPPRPQTSLPPELQGTAVHSAPLDRYLAKVERQLMGRWAIVVAGLHDLRALHRTRLEGNDKGNESASKSAPLVSVVELELDAFGKLARSRVVRRSGWHLFDYQAKLLLERVRWPTPPPLGEKRLVLRWVFFEDGRGCARRFARVSTRPLSKRAALARALRRGDTVRASRLVEGAAGAEAVAVLVEHALRDPRPRLRRLALRLVGAATLVRRLRDHRDTLDAWQATLAEVRRRGAKAVVAKAIARLGRPLYTWRPAAAAERRAQELRLAALLRYAAATKLAVEKTVVLRALRSPRAQTRRAALRLCHDVATLLRALERSKGDQRLGVPMLFANLAKLKGAGQTREAQAAIAYLRRLLVGADVALRRVALEAAARWPLPALRSAIVALPRSAPPLDRARRLRALARYGDIMVLYRHLKASQAPVRLAALEELGRFPGAGLGASYRLSTQAYHAPEPFRSAAIVALVRIGHPRMARDIEFLLRRLPKATKRVVIPQLVALGPRGKTALKLLGVADAQVPRASAAVSSPSRRAVLQRLVHALAAKPAKAEGRRVAKERETSSPKKALVSVRR